MCNLSTDRQRQEIKYSLGYVVTGVREQSVRKGKKEEMEEGEEGREGREKERLGRVGRERCRFYGSLLPQVEG